MRKEGGQAVDDYITRLENLTAKCKFYDKAKVKDRVLPNDYNDEILTISTIEVNGEVFATLEITQPEKKRKSPMHRCTEQCFAHQATLHNLLREV